MNVWHFIKLNKLQNYIQIKRIKTINTYSAKHLSIAAGSTVAQAWGTAVQEAGLPCSLPGEFPEQSTPHSLPSHSLPFFVTYMKHTAKYILISQELYWCSRHFTMTPREPAFWEDGMSVQTLGGFPIQKHKLSLSPKPLDLHLPKSSLPRFKQAVHTGTPDQHWPATLADSHNVSSALFVDKGIDYQILQRI